MPRTSGSCSVLSLVTFAFLPLLGCGDSAPSIKCSDAGTEACMCADGKAGVQRCGAADAGNACDCSGSGAFNTAGTSGGGGGTAGSTTAAHDDAGGVNHDAAVSGNDDGGSAPGSSDASVDSGTGSSGGHDAGPGDYSGPCNNDKSCPGSDTCVHMVGVSVSYCAASCMKSSDCPTPANGKATPICVGANPILSQPGTCGLNCGGLLAGDCPTGMQCSDLLLISGQCAWKGTI